MNWQLILVIGIFGLSISSGAEAAKWAKFDSMEDEGGKVLALVYVDRDSFQRTGNLVKATFLTDSRKPHEYSRGRKARSWIEQMEFDCQKRLMRYMHVAHYPGKMGQGSAHSTSAAQGSYGKWQKAESDVDDSDLFRLKKACALGRRQK